MNAYTILNSQFTVFTDVSSGKKFAKCNYCESLLKYHHSTSSLTYHLRSKHSAVATSRSATRPNRDGKILSVLPAGLAVKSEQPSSQSTTPATALSQQLTQWIARDSRPVDIVEDQGLRDLLQAATGSPNLQLPDRRTILSQLEFLHEREKSKIGGIVDGLDYVALTADSWSTGGDSFSSIRCHYVSTGWQLQSALLSIEHSSDKYMAVNVDEHFSNLATDWKMDVSKRLSHMVINNLSAVNDSETVKIERTACFAHLLRLSINNAMVVCSLDDKVNGEILGYYNSYMEQDPTKHEVTILRMSSMPAGQDISTLWRWTYLMVDCLIKNRNDISNQPLDDEWSEFTALHKLLEPFEKAIGILGGVSYATASSVLPLIAYLRQQMDVAAEDSAYTQEFKQVFLTQFNLNIENLTHSKDLQAATVLDIRYKRLLSLPKDKRADVWSLLHSITRKAFEGAGKLEESVPKKPRTSLLSLAGDEKVAMTEDNVSNDIYMSEFELYKHLPQINDDDQCPLLWWRQNESTYPTLSKIAKKYLAIPATSIPCEQLFSDIGEKLNRKRCALYPDDVNRIVCLSDWLS